MKILAGILFSGGHGDNTCGTGLGGLEGLLPFTCVKHGFSSHMLVERWSWVEGCQTGWRTPKRTLRFSQSQGRPPEAAPTCGGWGKASDGLEGEWVPESSILYRCLWLRARGKAAGMQESCPGHVPTGWGGRALQSTSLLSSLCKQQRHTDSLCVCARAGGASGLRGPIATHCRWEPLLPCAGPRWVLGLPTPAGRSLCTGWIHSLAPFIPTPQQAPLLPTFIERETEALKSHTLPRAQSGSAKPGLTLRSV